VSRSPRASATASAQRSITEDLLARFAGPAVLPPGSERGTIVITYVRAHHLNANDPREFVLRPSRTWTLSPRQTMGFGRAPDGVSVGVPLSEDGGIPDTSMPRLAGRLQYANGAWRLSNHATNQAILRVTAPGMTQGVSNSSDTSDALPIRHRRMIVTVPAICGPVGDVDEVEHRFTLLAPHLQDDLPTLGRWAASSQSAASKPLAPPAWQRDQRRVLAAWAYPELLGLPPRGFRRGQLARRMLRLPLTGDDPLEKPLKTIRKRAERVTGVPMAGETGTPALLGYIVQLRGYLADALAELHAEYDSIFPPPMR
jgi:hypothetical protein